VVERASEILRSLEQDEVQRGGRPSLTGAPAQAQRQLGLFQPPAPEPHPVVARLQALDPDALTPLEALNLIATLKREADA
jgi:DNA mismatch repair protein MutS